MMLPSQVLFGRNFFALVALVSIWVIPIIPNITVERRWSTDALKLTYIVFLMTSPNHGFNIYLRLNILSTLDTILQPI